MKMKRRDDAEPDAPTPRTQQQVASALVIGRGSRPLPRRGSGSRWLPAPGSSSTAPAGRGRSRGSRRAGWRRSPRRRRPGTCPRGRGSPCPGSPESSARRGPGQEKIVSIVIAPPTTAPNWIADSVTSGSSALGTAWLRTTRCQGRPVARLTVTKSSVRTSTIDERMIRKYWPKQHQRHRGDGQDHVVEHVHGCCRRSWRSPRRESSEARPGTSESRPRRRGSG